MRDLNVYSMHNDEIPHFVLRTPFGMTVKNDEKQRHPERKPTRTRPHETGRFFTSCCALVQNDNCSLYSMKRTVILSEPPGEAKDLIEETAKTTKTIVISNEPLGEMRDLSGDAVCCNGRQ
jgi:hypothetical protein